MFLHLSVSHSVHRGVGVSRPTPKQEVGGSGHGESPGPHPAGKVGGLAGEGSPGPHPGWWWWIPACAEADPQPPNPSPQQTATDAGGTNPTGMHSCVKWFLDITNHLIVKFKRCVVNEKLMSLFHASSGYSCVHCFQRNKVFLFMIHAKQLLHHH